MNYLQDKKPLSSIKYGDRFLLGDHELLCADATDTKAIGEFIGKREIKQINSDVPYGILYAGSKKGFSKIKVDKEILNDDFVSDADYAAFTKAWLTAVIPHLAKKNSVFIFNCDKMVFALREGMLQAGVKFSQLLIWIKSHSTIGRKDFLPMHELVCYGWVGSHDFHRAQEKSVLFFPKPNKSPLHPTQKPVGLIRKLILTTTNIGDYVYDGFGGSGTCLIACEQTKRKCLMVELDPDYCQTIINRWEALTGHKAVKFDGVKDKEAHHE